MTVDDVPVVLSGSMQVVFAALALAGGRRVSVDDLIGYPWGDRHPFHPRRALQSMIVQLRASSVGAEMITAVADGYALESTCSVVDVQAFRDLARRAQDGNSAEGTRDVLHQALDLCVVNRLPTWRRGSFALKRRRS